MQVARQNMPVSSIVVGVDLFPIKPIPGCIGLVEDITTEKCRTSIAKELQTWKADVVLHDGAPNVGKNWLHDAYQQACLTLSSLKLATQFLRTGGWFITKVFRSKDYHPLIWVLKQLFRKVHATKPQASRNESAEIFVVCQGYTAPDKIDPKFMDPRHVFEELDVDSGGKLNILHPEKRKAKAQGYPDNDYTLHHVLLASEWTACDTNSAAIEALQRASEIKIDDKEINENKHTTNEILECCKDIRVLGRRELRLLLAWQKALHDELHKVKTEKTVNEPSEKEVIEEQETDEDENIDQQIAELKSEELREARRQKKKANKERKKLNERLNLKMVLKGDSGPTLEGEETFSLKRIENERQLRGLSDQAPDLVAEESNSDSEHLPRSKYERYDKETRHLDSSGTYYKDTDSELEMESDSDDESAVPGRLGLKDEPENNIANNKKNKSDKSNPLLTDLDHRNREQKRAHKAELWFGRDIFKGLVDEGDEDRDLDRLVDEYKKKGAKIVNEQQQENSVATDAPADYTDNSSESDSDSDTENESDNEIQKKAKGLYIYSFY